MSSDGYTLVEMLVALVVVGMTAAGLAEGAHTLTRIQAEAAGSLQRERAMATLQSRFGAFVGQGGPFRSDDKPARFRGSADDLSFDCGQGTCTAQILTAHGGTALELGYEDGRRLSLPLPGVAGASFAYDDGASEGADWPPAGEGLRLKAVAILGGFEPDRSPLAVARIDAEQAPDCEFDPIVRQCRAGSNGRG